MTTALQGTPITISLTQLALSSGWSVNRAVATHDSCNSGYIYLNNYPLTPGQTYTYSYQVLSITPGYVQAFLGTIGGAQQTTAGIVTETVVANGTQLSFYSNGACSITLFSIESVQAITSPTSRNTMAFAEKTGKWYFYTYIPDNAFSIFTSTFSFYQGVPYFHQQGSFSRGIFYGVPYNYQVLFSSNEQPSVVKTFLGINYQSNQLLLPPSLGITTSLGQVSGLFAGNFLQATYNDGTQVYSIEGLYKSSFLRDMNVDLTNGSPLKGNWLQMGLMGQFPAASTPLQLFTTELTYAHSSQGIR